LIAPEIKPPVWSIVTGLVAKLVSIAAVVPMIVPELTIAEPGANETPVLTRMPLVPVMVPEFDSLPEKVLIPKRTMPSPFAVIFPLLLIPPERLVMFSITMLLPPTEIEPELEIPSEKFVLKRATMPLVALEMVPLLEMPPEISLPKRRRWRSHPLPRYCRCC
jgi:hypothetical protein